nr:Chain A, Alpha-synuclein [Homo sapiens]
AVVTGVTAV